MYYITHLNNNVNKIIFWYNFFKFLYKISYIKLTQFVNSLNFITILTFKIEYNFFILN